MEAIGTNKPIIALPAPVRPASPAPSEPANASSAPAAPAATKAPAPAGYNAQAAEQARVQNVQKATQQIANTFIVSDQTFSIFKDKTGQYITRFTSLRDGKVTYIPQPSLFSLGGSSGAAVTPSVTIQA